MPWQDDAARTSVCACYYPPAPSSPNYMVRFENTSHGQLQIDHMFDLVAAYPLGSHAEYPRTGFDQALHANVYVYFLVYGWLCVQRCWSMRNSFPTFFCGLGGSVDGEHQAYPFDGFPLCAGGNRLHLRALCHEGRNCNLRKELRQGQRPSPSSAELTLWQDEGLEGLLCCDHLSNRDFVA